jgi:hypothetical protein
MVSFTRSATLLAICASIPLVLLNMSPLLHAPDNPSPHVFPGDSIIPDPEMHYNHVIAVHAPASTIFPWILQLGKGRGGWYLPASYERLLPKSMHAARSINTAWTALGPGDRVEDYGFNPAEDYFIVAEVKHNQALVYKSERYGTIFTWTLVVDEIGSGVSEVRLRFRGRIQSTGFRRSVIVWGGSWMDWLSTAPMLKGLKERAESER